MGSVTFRKSVATPAWINRVATRGDIESMYGKIDQIRILRVWTIAYVKQ